MRKLSPNTKRRRLLLEEVRRRRKKRRKLSRAFRLQTRDKLLAERRRFAAANDIYFERDLRRTSIILPSRLSLDDNYNETAQVFSLIRKTVLLDRRPATLHFEHVTYIDPTAALLLVAEVFRANRLRNAASGRAIDGTYPRDATVMDALVKLGFFKILSVPVPPTYTGQADEDAPIFLRFLTDVHVRSELIDWFVEVIERAEILMLDEPSRRKLVGAIIEAMSNAHEHAYRNKGDIPTLPHRWYMSASVHPENHEVQIILADQGMGIPLTLDLSLFDQLKASDGAIRTLVDSLRGKHSDGLAIKAATELWRTSTRQRGRGRGFRDMKAFVDACPDGELKVLSNRGSYHYVAGAESYADESLSICGTIIRWRIRNDSAVMMKDD